MRLLLSVLLAGFTAQAAATVGSHGMVVSDAPLASNVGVKILQSGGNAIDAAIATAFALAVVLPDAGNIGGGGFAVVHIKGETVALDFRETAPAAAKPNMYLDALGVPTPKSVTGHLAVGVPGSVAGLWELHRKYGSKKWAELLQPAVELARRGFTVESDFSTDIADDAKRLAQFPASTALFLPAGHPPHVAAHWQNPDLARVLKRIALEGRDGFYKGQTADLLLAEVHRGGGIITRQDLAGYQAKWRAPVLFSYRGFRIASMPPPSSGGVTMAMIAHELEIYDLAKLGWHTTDAVHLQAEAMRRAFAVRNEVVGDPDFVNVDAAKLASTEFGRELARSIALKRATPSDQVSGKAGMQVGGKHTTHFSVTDQSGNVVALTTTLNSSFGSGVTVTGGGFVLNNEMDDFTSKPGSPNQFGLIQGEANAISPGKRMMSAMTPTIVFNDQNQPVFVTGASGGPYITTTVFQLISDVIDYHMDVAGAMSAGRMHHQHLPDEISLEKDKFPPETLAGLRSRGHKLTFFEVPSSGWTIAASIAWKNGHWEGVSDPRIHGAAVGY